MDMIEHGRIGGSLQQFKAGANVFDLLREIVERAAHQTAPPARPHASFDRIEGICITRRATRLARTATSCCCAPFNSDLNPPTSKKSDFRIMNGSSVHFTERVRCGNRSGLLNGSLIGLSGLSLRVSTKKRSTSGCTRAVLAIV